MIGARTGVAFATALLIAAPTATTWADNEIPIPGMAQGSQSGDGAPFTGLAQSPGTELFTGSATTAVPLTVPQGRLDMTPQLALAYSSRAGRSPYGFGWNLPTGRISRSTKHGVPVYDDSVDTFVLELPGSVVELVPDGGKLYRAKFGGTFFKIGYNDTTNHWKVIDPDGTSFTFGRTAERNARSGPDTTTADGTFAWHLERSEDIYGNTIDFSYMPVDGSPNGAMRDGLLDYVAYGGNGRAALDHMFRIDFLWKFTPLAQSRQWEFARGFAAIADDAWTLDRANAVFIDEFGVESTVRSYDLGYDRDAVTEIARLADVELTATTSNSTVVLPATVFQYTNALDLTGWPLGSPAQRIGPPAQPYAVNVNSPSPSGFGFRDTNGKIKRDLVDINGDSLIDAIYLDAGVLEVRLGTGGDFASPISWPFPAGFTELRDHVGKLRSNLLDLDGDALPDFVHAAGNQCAATLGDPCWDVYRNTGSGFDSTPTPWNAPRNHIQRNDRIEAQPYDHTTAIRSNTIDLNNDGLPDFVDAADVVDTWDGLWKVYWNTGSGFTQTPDVWSAPSSPEITIEYLGATRISEVVGGDPSHSLYGLFDMNGDGLPDLVRSDTDGVFDTGPTVGFWQVWLNNGFGFEDVTEWRVPGALVALPNTLGSNLTFVDSFVSSRELIDMTGDGLPDLVGHFLYNFTPLGSSCPSGAGQAPACPGPGGPYPPECCELVPIFTNTGSGFAAPLGIPAWSATQHIRRNNDPNGQPIVTVANRELLDFDGDGLIDLLESDGTNWSLYPNWRTPRAYWSNVNAAERYKPNLLVAMMNGLGSINTLEYAPASLLNDAMCWRDGSGQAVAGACLPFPHWVVTAVESTDSLSSVPTTYTNYAYADGKYDGIAREFRGFGRAATIDAQGRTIVTEYHQDAARSGRVQRSWTLGNPDCGPSQIPAPLDPTGPCNPWNHKLGLEENDWGNPLDSADGRPPLLFETYSVPYFANFPRALLAKTTAYIYDAYGNEDLRTTVTPNPLTPSAVNVTWVDATFDNRVDKVTAGMPDRYIVNRPTAIKMRDSDGVLHEKKFTYKSLRYAKTVETCRSWTSGASGTSGPCSAWTRRGEARNSLGLVSKSKAESKRRARYFYGDRYRLYPTKIRDQRRETAISYDQSLGRPVLVVDPAGEESRFVYDALGRALEHWAPSPITPRLGAVSLVETRAYVEAAPALGAPGRIRVDAADATPVVTFYDGLGREIATKTSQGTAYGATVMVVSNLASYDAFGRPTATAAPVVATNQSNLEVLSTTFNATSFEERTQTTYDVVTGKRTSVSPPDDAVVDFEYRVPGLEIVRDSAGLMTIRYLDALGRAYRRDRCVDPVPLSSIYSGYECPLAHRRERLEYAFDGMDRTTVSWAQNLEAPGAPMEWLRASEFDGLGNEVRIRDRNTGEWLRSFDKSGLHTMTQGPDGTLTTHKYKRGQLLETNVSRPDLPDTHTTTRSYVGRNLPGAGKLESVSTTDGLGGSERTLSYTPRGLVASETIKTSSDLGSDTFTSNYRIDTIYDEADHVLASYYPSSATSSQRVDVLRNGAGQVIRLFDDSGALLIDDIHYDIYGNTTEVAYGNGLSDRYGYDGQATGGRLACVRTAATSSGLNPCQYEPQDLRALVYSYDSVGRISSVTDQQSSLLQTHTFGFTSAYDDDGRLAQATYQQALAIPIEKDVYTYDSLARIAARERTDAVAITNLAYDYGASSPDADPDGPITPLHHLLAYGSTAIGHDAAGRQISKGTTGYTYDQLGRLREMSAAGVTRTINQYGDGTARVAKYEPASDRLVHYFGGRFEVHIDVASQSAELVRHFSIGGQRIASDRIAAPDGLVVVSSTASGGPAHAVSTRALAGPHALATMADARETTSRLALAMLIATAGTIFFAVVAFPDRRRIALTASAALLLGVLPIPHVPQTGFARGLAFAQTSPDARVYYHTDHLGSVQLVTDDDPTGGQLIESMRYRAFGEVRAVFGEAPGYVSENPVELETSAGFGGHEPDTQSQLLYFGARHYDPEIGMFLSPDSAAQFASPYAFSGWDPVNSYDPDGNVAVLVPLIQALYFVSQVASAALSIAAIVQNPSAGPMAVVQQYVLPIVGGGWKGVGTALLSTMARLPSGFQRVLQTANVAVTGINAAQAFKNGDTLGALVSISAVASGAGDIGGAVSAKETAGTPALSAAKFLATDISPTASGGTGGAASGFQGKTNGDGLGSSAGTRDTPLTFESRAELSAFYQALGGGGGNDVVFFGKRPLELRALGDEAANLRGAELDAANIEGVHEEVFVLTGEGELQHAGFSKTSGIVSDPFFSVRVYEFGLPVFVGPRGRTFLQNVPGAWSPDDYNLFTNNCQDFCDAVRARIQR